MKEIDIENGREWWSEAFSTGVWLRRGKGRKTSRRIGIIHVWLYCRVDTKMLNAFLHWCYFIWRPYLSSICTPKTLFPSHHLIFLDMLSKKYSDLGELPCRGRFEHGLLACCCRPSVMAASHKVYEKPYRVTVSWVTAGATCSWTVVSWWPSFEVNFLTASLAACMLADVVELDREE